MDGFARFVHDDGKMRIENDCPDRLMKIAIFKMASARSRRGFTLVELLVVITIIIVLAALSFTGYGKMRSMADKAGATRNIAQLQIANVSYATDHNGNFVPIRVNDSTGKATGRWFQNEDYLRNLLGGLPENQAKQDSAVPLELLDPKVVRARNDKFNWLYASYGMNDTGLPLGNAPGLSSSHNLNRISNPAQSMAFTTATDYRVTYNSRFNWNSKNPNDSKTAAGDMAYRHNNKVLVVYFDGHVGEMSESDMKAIDAKGGKSNPFWTPEAK